MLEWLTQRDMRARTEFVRQRSEQVGAFVNYYVHSYILPWMGTASQNDFAKLMPRQEIIATLRRRIERGYYASGHDEDILIARRYLHATESRPAAGVLHDLFMRDIYPDLIRLPGIGRWTLSKLWGTEPELYWPHICTHLMENPEAVRAYYSIGHKQTKTLREYASAWYTGPLPVRINLDKDYGQEFALQVRHGYSKYSRK